jgi:hypothetical protein
MEVVGEGFWPGSDSWGSPTHRLKGSPQLGACLPNSSISFALQKLEMFIKGENLNDFATSRSFHLSLTKTCRTIAKACSFDTPGVLGWKGSDGTNAVPLLLTAFQIFNGHVPFLANFVLSQNEKLCVCDVCAGALATLSANTQGGGDCDLSTIRLDLSNKIVGVLNVCCDAFQAALSSGSSPMFVPEGVIALVGHVIKCEGRGGTSFYDDRLLPLLSQVSALAASSFSLS